MMEWPLRLERRPCSPVEEFQYVGEMMEEVLDGRIGAASTVMQSFYWSMVVEREMSHEAELSIYRFVHAPTIT